MGGLQILYVEDDARLAQQVCALIAGAGDSVTWCPTATEGIAKARESRFDVVILDRMLPDSNGLDLVRRLRAAGVDAPMLMLSALGRAENRVDGLEAGVDDYMGKPFEPGELVARVRALHRRAAGQAHSAVILFGDLECHVKARTAHRRGRHIPLSPKEFTLFAFLMEHAGEVVTREMLLRHVWNLNFDPQTNVIDVSVSRLRRKLEEGFDGPVLETIWGAGYRLVAA
ncbi:response regulator transcription factor [Sphingomonas sp.]|jgi:DNA-binding response OmpR family regulator|uniref:response regulator transcription factor n=1 Tax=Sphingomonas sp. TaxID=28214 RepID=UPI002D7E2728|nr:response regulator transcription factor [Sphingomonas sp.]HEU0045247.1 response regulator transcription factor [Sphingomonas sp.]